MIELLKEERKRKQVSQRELAKRCGLPQSTIARIESGAVEPNYATVEKMMKGLGVELKVVESNKSTTLSRWENLRFTCYWRDQPTAEVYVRGREVYVKRYIQHPVKQIFYKDKMDVFALSKILEGRCWEENRVGMEDILAKLGLQYYDPLEIVKKTHGVSYNDFLWFEFANEHLYWKDVAPRRVRNV